MRQATAAAVWVRVVPSKRDVAAVALSVTEYSLLVPVSVGTSKSGADAKVSTPLLLIAKSSLSSPVSDHVTVPPASAAAV